MIHTNILRFRRHMYLWWSLLVMAGAFILYGSQADPQRRSGHTWQGYALGVVGVLLIGWLSALAVRKRRYASTMGTLQGWTSAHVYLGAALLIVATLHCAFQFGLNVHTLAYVLMCLVIGSGLFGLYVYLDVPKLVAENREGASREALFEELFALSKQARATSEACDTAVQTSVESSIQRTAIGGGAWAQLSGADYSRFVSPATGNAVPALTQNRDQQAVINLVADRIPRAQRREETAQLQQLLLLLCRRQVLLRRLRQDIRLHGWLKVWLFFHIRVTAALLVALAVHIIVIFIY